MMVAVSAVVALGSGCGASQAATKPTTRAHELIAMRRLTPELYASQGMASTPTGELSWWAAHLT